MCVASVPTTHPGVTNADKLTGLVKAGGPMMAVRSGLSGDRSGYESPSTKMLTKAGQYADKRANDRAITNATPQQAQQAQYGGTRGGGGEAGGSLLVPSATQGGLVASTTNPNKTLLGG